MPTRSDPSRIQCFGRDTLQATYATASYSAPAGASTRTVVNPFEMLASALHPVRADGGCEFMADFEGRGGPVTGPGLLDFARQFRSPSRKPN